MISPATIDLAGIKVRPDRPVDRERPCCRNVCTIRLPDHRTKPTDDIRLEPVVSKLMPTSKSPRGADDFNDDLNL